MILQALANHYTALFARGEITPPGWETANVSFALSLDAGGNIVALASLMREEERGKKTVLRPTPMQVPATVKRTVGIEANFLCDNGGYLLAIDGKGKPERTLQCFEASRALHQRLLKDCTHPGAKALLAFFDSWVPARASLHPELAPKLNELMAGGNLVFRFGGEYLQDIPELREIWQRSYDESGGEEGLCLISGEKTEIARVHPDFKNVRGARSSGAALVSFNAPAYDSYGKSQGGNAPVGKTAAFAYGAALNHLLADQNHRLTLGDMTIVFWAEGASPPPQDFFAALLDISPAGGNSPAMDDNSLLAAMKELAEGRTIDWQDETLSPDTPFYVLALSPNASRLSVRFFLRSRFGKLSQNLLDHQERLEIVRPKQNSRRQLGFWQLINETVNQKSSDKKPSSIMAGELLRAILEGGRYPATLLNGVNIRIRADHDDQKINPNRAAIIKAYYLKNQHKDCPKEVLTVSLNDTNHIPYRLGRLFSVLEAIQQAANPGINATIKDKYFNSASATPSIILPRLVDLAQNHLRKLSEGQKVYYNKQLGEIMGPLGIAYPDRLTLPEQGSFQLGYYHQNQDRYTKKEDKENA